MQTLNFVCINLHIDLWVWLRAYTCVHIIYYNRGVVRKNGLVGPVGGLVDEVRKFEGG